MKPTPRLLRLNRALRRLVLMTFSLVLIAQSTVDAPSGVWVNVHGRAEYVRVGSTVHDAARRYHIKPHDGDLLDVEGKLITHGHFPGDVLLNGYAAPASTMLATGDNLDTLNGEDQREPLKVEAIPVDRRRRPSPQFQLDAVPGIQFVTKGALSGKLVSVAFDPEGPGGSSPIVALTFDDGPNPAYTPRIIEILRRYRVEATFFVVGVMAARYPKLVHEELKHGFVVANHTWGHPFIPSFSHLSKARIKTEIEHAQRVLKGYGAKPRLFRPPGGAYSPTVLKYAKANNLRTVLWSIDPRDWQTDRTAQQIVDHVLARVRTGSIVLLHDGGPNREATVEALPALIEGIRKKGLRLVALEP